MTENNVKVNYSDLVSLGFKKVNCEDDLAHLTQYGYPYFFLLYGEDGDTVSMEWSPTDREVTLYINSHTYRKGISLDEVKDIIKMLTDE